MFSKKKGVTSSFRTVKRFDQLRACDLVTFKYRQILPQGISGETLHVDSVGTYDYGGEVVADFRLSHSSGIRVNAIYDAENDEVTLSSKIAHSEIIEMFDDDDLARVFDPTLDRVKLSLNSEETKLSRKPWVCAKYQRTVCEGMAYYYAEDRREQGVSKFEDESMPFMYFELKGDSDHHALSIEVWEDGETEFFADLTVAASVVDVYLPSSNNG